MRIYLYPWSSDISVRGNSKDRILVSCIEGNKLWVGYCYRMPLLQKGDVLGVLTHKDAKGFSFYDFDCPPPILHQSKHQQITIPYPSPNHPHSLSSVCQLPNRQIITLQLVHHHHGSHQIPNINLPHQFILDPQPNIITSSQPKSPCRRSTTIFGDPRCVHLEFASSEAISSQPRRNDAVQEGLNENLFHWKHLLHTRYPVYY